MRELWQRFILSLTPGVRWAVSIWTALFLAAIVLGALKVINLAGWLGFSGPDLWHGQVWRLLSYALLPGSICNWLTNAFVVICFGGMLERVWLPRDFFLYCAIAAAGAALADAALQPSSPAMLLGPTPVAFAVLLAAGRVCANEPMLIPPSFQLTVRQLVAVFALISLVMTFFAGGWVNTVILLAGGGSGLLYLWLRSEVGQPRDAQSVVSQRINRLEL